jgi:hypothetical protein
LQDWVTSTKAAVDAANAKAAGKHWWSKH